MMRRALPACAGVALALATAACGNDSPVAVGEQLLPGDPVTSFEVVLEADQFLALDSAFALFTNTAQSSFTMVANDFESALDARALARFSIPNTITVIDSAGSSAIDTLPRYFGGRLVLLVDTARSSHDDARFAVYQAAESWEQSSATWELRSDTGESALPWTQPGGTLGPLLAAGDWARADGDTMFLELDSATVQTLRDDEVAARGLIVTTETAGARMRLIGIGLRADARSSIVDTVVTATAVSLGRTFIYSPAVVPRSDDGRVGGIPAWRTLLRLQPDLRDLSVPCPDEPGCTMPLSETEITVANLEYQLAAPPPGFVIEDSLRIGAVPLFETPGVPFSRSLLGSFVQAVPADRFVRPSDFDDVANAEPLRVPITSAIRSALDEESTPVGIALIPGVPLGTFGYVPLQPLPRLRLILTISQEVQLQ